MEKKNITHYSSSQKILLVGEGDFSFSLCLAKAFDSAVNMYHRNFDRIIFNFPHSGVFSRENYVSVIEQHKNVVSGFLRNAKDMLSYFGQIHITHKTTHPYSCWNIKNLGEDLGLSFLEEVDFDQFSYPGYNNKRGAGSNCDQSFPIGESSTFKFGFCWALF
ncbi:unnamed protein product [Trifolium pratense]|uniref:Uncharacterized protein n=1 Tax=Trifolium pratense TaxID=57577 RepID=A0ACB0IYY3_TRIPR|nr:unnamed protein product [Trifolium pratense]